jgi:hypothetical protein
MLRDSFGIALVSSEMVKREKSRGLLVNEVGDFVPDFLSFRDADDLGLPDLAVPVVQCLLCDRCYSRT